MFPKTTYMACARKAKSPSEARTFLRGVRGTVVEVEDDGDGQRFEARWNMEVGFFIGFKATRWSEDFSTPLRIDTREGSG